MICPHACVFLMSILRVFLNIIKATCLLRCKKPGRLISTNKEINNLSHRTLNGAQGILE